MTFSWVLSLTGIGSQYRRLMLRKAMILFRFRWFFFEAGYVRKFSVVSDLPPLSRTGKSLCGGWQILQFFSTRSQQLTNTAVKNSAHITWSTWPDRQTVELSLWETTFETIGGIHKTCLPRLHLYYRVTHQVRQNLSLTLIWKLRFSIRPSY